VWYVRPLSKTCVLQEPNKPLKNDGTKAARVLAAALGSHKMNANDSTIAALLTEVRHALPSVAEWIAGDHLVRTRVLESPTLLSEIPLVGWDERPSIWQQFIVFGGWSLAGGASPFWCLNMKDADVFHVDVEAEDHTNKLNCSIAQFIRCFEAVDMALGKQTMTPSHALGKIEELDRTSFDGDNEWRKLLEYVVHAQQAVAADRAKPRSG
jgi:hypothetical protein